MVDYGPLEPGPALTDDPPTVGRVAEIMVGATTIGRACAALQAAGWQSTIAGNRITVADRVFARYLDPGPRGAGHARWLVYGGDGQSSFQIVIASG